MYTGTWKSCEYLKKKKKRNKNSFSSIFQQRKTECSWDVNGWKRLLKNIGTKIAIFGSLPRSVRAIKGSTFSCKYSGLNELIYNKTESPTLKHSSFLDVKTFLRAWCSPNRKKKLLQSTFLTTILSDVWRQKETFLTNVQHKSQLIYTVSYCNTQHVREN